MASSYYAAYFNLDASPVSGAILRFNMQPANVSSQPDLLEFHKGDLFQIEPKDIGKTLHDYILSLDDSLSNATLFLDDCSALKALNLQSKLSIGWVAREGDLEEQVSHYRGVLSNPRPHISDFEFTNLSLFLIEANLMFPELAASNLIDPIEVDDKKEFPYTEALLVLCKGIESYLKYTPSFSTAEVYRSNRKAHS